MKRRTCLSGWAELCLLAAKVTIFLIVVAAFATLAHDLLNAAAVPATLSTPPIDAKVDDTIAQLERLNQKLDLLLADGGS